MYTHAQGWYLINLARAQQLNVFNYLLSVRDKLAMR